MQCDLYIMFIEGAFEILRLETLRFQMMTLHSYFAIMYVRAYLAYTVRLRQTRPVFQILACSRYILGLHVIVYIKTDAMAP